MNKLTVLVLLTIAEVVTDSLSQVCRIAEIANKESNPQLIKDDQRNIWCFWQELHEDTGA